MCTVEVISSDNFYLFFIWYCQMPNRRPCACDKCGRKFDLVHHLHRHAVLSHGLGYRVDPDTDCLQAFRPTDLAELQERFRGWQGRNRESRSRSPQPLPSGNVERRGRAPSRGRGGRGRRSWKPSRSRSPHPAETRQPTVEHHRFQSPVTEPYRGLRASKVVAASHNQRESGDRRNRLEVPTTPAALGAPRAEVDDEETLNARIDRLLQPPIAPESPTQLADISFASVDSDPFEGCVINRPHPPTSQPPASALRDPVDHAVVSSESGSLSAGDLSVVLGRWPAGVRDAWLLLSRGPLPPVGSPEYLNFSYGLRVARTTARVMAGLILSLPGFDEPDDRLPPCVIDWLCRFFR